MSQYCLLQDADIEPLGEHLFQVLEKVGFLCQNAELLKALERAGARVDHAAERVAIPREMSEELLVTIRSEAPAERSGSKSFAAPGLPHLGTQIAQFYYDYGKRERRSGNRADFVELIKLGSALHPDVAVGHSLLLTDVPPMLEPLEAALLLAEYASRPDPAFAWNVRQVD